MSWTSRLSASRRATVWGIGIGVSSCLYARPARGIFMCASRASAGRTADQRIGEVAAARKTDLVLAVPRDMQHVRRLAAEPEYRRGARLAEQRPAPGSRLDRGQEAEFGAGRRGADSINLALRIDQVCEGGPHHNVAGE